MLDRIKLILSKLYAFGDVILTKIIEQSFLSALILGIVIGYVFEPMISILVKVLRFMLSLVLKI